MACSFWFFSRNAELCAVPPFGLTCILLISIFCLHKYNRSETRISYERKDRDCGVKKPKASYSYCTCYRAFSDSFVSIPGIFFGGYMGLFTRVCYLLVSLVHTRNCPFPPEKSHSLVEFPEACLQKASSLDSVITRCLPGNCYRGGCFPPVCSRCRLDNDHSRSVLCWDQCPT